MTKQEWIELHEEYFNLSNDNTEIENNNIHRHMKYAEKIAIIGANKQRMKEIAKAIKSTSKLSLT